MNNFFGKLKDGAEKVAFEAEKLNKITRAKFDLENVKNQIQTQYLKLGEMYYTQRATAGVSGQAYDEICQAIADLEHQVQSKNEEIQRLNTETYVSEVTQMTPPPVSGSTTPNAPQNAIPSTPPPTAGTTKFCSNCGKEIPVTVKFCPECGKNV